MAVLLPGVEFPEGLTTAAKRPADGTGGETTRHRGPREGDKRKGSPIGRIHIGKGISMFSRDRVCGRYGGAVCGFASAVLLGSGGGISMGDVESDRGRLPVGVSGRDWF